MESEFRHNVRGIEEIHKYGGDFYRRIVEINKGFADFVEDAYEGFEHKPGNLEDKLPNRTVIWNLPFANGGFMYGSSLGHVHPKAGFKIQEIYEFQGYGGMLVSFKEHAKLYVCKPQDKVVVPPDCMMTILNFSVGSLETLDMANPLQNESSKKILGEKNGPQIALYTSGADKDDWFCQCNTFLSHKFNRRVVFSHNEKVKIRLNKNYEVFGIDHDEEINIKVANYNGGLDNGILECKDEFKKYNIDVCRASIGLDYLDEYGELHVMNISLERLVGSSSESFKEMLKLK